MKIEVGKIFELVINGRKATLEAHILLIKQVGPYLNVLSSSTLADYMLDVIQYMKNDDRWLSIRSKILISPNALRKSDVVSNKEKRFFDFAEFLTQESQWADLFKHFLK